MTDIKATQTEITLYDLEFFITDDYAIVSELGGFSIERLNDGELIGEWANDCLTIYSDDIVLEGYAK